MYGSRYLRFHDVLYRIVARIISSNVEEEAHVPPPSVRLILGGTYTESPLTSRLRKSVRQRWPAWTTLRRVSTHKGDPRLISSWTTNWTANAHEPTLMTSSRWPLPRQNRTTGVGGSPRSTQPQMRPTHQRRQDQDNGERRHSMPHSHPE